MKTLHIASILALSVTLTFACGDDDDSSPTGTAGTSGSTAGGDRSAGGDNGAGEGPDAGGKAGSGQAGSAQAGSGQAGNGQAGNGQAGEGNGGGGAGAGGAPVVEECVFGDYDSGGEGGAAGAGGQASAGFELIGSWEEDYGNNFINPIEITSSHWNTAGIAAYDNEENVVYTQTPCDSLYSAGRFSKIFYLQEDDSFYYCTAVYDAKTLAEAQAAEGVADPENLETGCGSSGFPWSLATPK